MNKEELKIKIKSIAQQAYSDIKGGKNAIINKFPTLKEILSDLMTPQYNLFIEKIMWVAPRPTTFRINLINEQYFFLIFSDRSWIAQIEGKKYYLLNLKEEESAIEAIARILMYGTPEVLPLSGIDKTPPPPPPAEEVPITSIPAEEIPPAA